MKKLLTTLLIPYSISAFANNADIKSPVTGNATEPKEIHLKECASELSQITDMQFVSYKDAIISTQEGDLYWFAGCGEPLTKIGTIDVAKDGYSAGLYSIAIDWSFVWTNRVYAYYLHNSDGVLKTRLASYIVDPVAGSVEEEEVLLDIPQPYDNSNGGAMRFGPDGNLYLGIGDGGSENDPHGNGQNVKTLLGSILRISPNFYDTGYKIPDGNLKDFSADAAPEIYAYGVHNPWKFTFSTMGDLIVADIGQHAIEEVNIISYNDSISGPINLGWSIKEGRECLGGGTNCDSNGLIDPAFQYPHAGNAGNSITGGETFLQDGSEYYYFADFVTGYIGVLDLTAPEQTVASTTFDGKNWTTFAKAYSGKVYVADYLGGIYQISYK